MTTINWEREPGDTVEEFVAALILTTVNSRAVRITPSRGDKGVDILAPVGDQFDVYQVKRYTRPFGRSSNEEISIINSWKRFVDEFMPSYPIRRWTLVTPWNPTTERYDWLRNELTADVNDIECDWLGRETLDVWSSRNAPLVEYFFGNGRDRMMELVASALNAAREIPEITGEPLLDAVATRCLELNLQLDEVDPFYRYEIIVRSGRLTESALDQMQSVDSNAALVTFREIDDTHYQQVSIYPKCAESGRLRPISTTVSIDSSTDAEVLQAAHDMIAYGAEPNVPLPVNIIRSEGPPGVQPPNGPAMLYVMNADRPGRPDLELRMDDACLEFKDISITHGSSGIQIIGRAGGDVFKVAVTLNSDGQTRSIEVQTLPIGGALPHVVVPGLEFMSDWKDEKEVSLAIPYGRVLMQLGGLPDAEPVRQQSQVWLEVARHLMRLQAVAAQQLLMPTRLKGSEANKIEDAVRLLDGETIAAEWTDTKFHVSRPEIFETILSTGPLFQFLTFLSFNIEYDNNRYDLDGSVAHWGLAQLADPAAAATLELGDQVAITPAPGEKLYRKYGSSEPLSC